MTKTSIFKFLISLALLLMPCFAASYVSLSPVLTEIIYALEGDKDLLGVSSVCNYPDDVKNKQIIGDTYFVNMEKLIKLKPEFLFSMNSNKPLLGQLPLINVKAEYFEFSSIQNIYDGINRIGKTINKEKKAFELINEIKLKISQNKTKEPKKILYIVQFNPLITVGKQSYINDVIEQSGHINVASDINFHYPNITLEYAIKKEPEIIVLCYSDKNDEIKKYFPKAKIIKLTTQEQDLINRPGPRIWQAVKIFSKM
ncbi:MAG: ABC transporter substrate-binding protein [Candidatus Gastranaerophilales bacterium]|nr:ABC transporter substrate-binding protein [Candidatus Gastranaerophilales bacterium]